MKGDFSRVSYRPEKNYSRVLMQQGRVQLDSDWNEQAALLVSQGREAVRAIIGPAGAPQGDDAQGRPIAGFRVVAKQGALSATGGLYFVAGLLARSDKSQIIRYDKDMGKSGQYVAYLDVWERHVTALDDPDIRELALGGPDTATRAQIMTQVRLRRVADRGERFTCADFVPPAPASGTLIADTVPPPIVPDDCVVPPEAQYRGKENQLYRVEIHRVGRDGRITFKWSRDNGTVVAKWVGQAGESGQYPND